MRHVSISLLLCCACLAGLSAASEIGFEEDFALAPDRAEALKQLIPGTDDYYYYHCLHAQNNGDYERVETLLKQWIQRHGQTARVEEIRNRQALLQFDKDPQKSLEFIRWRLDLNFNHERHIPGQKPNQPTALDPKLIAADTLTTRALEHDGDLSGFDDHALDALVDSPLFNAEKADGNRRRQLLQRLKRPDFASLPKLVVADLRFQYSGGFGSLPIHKLLLLDQLDECAKQMPKLLDTPAFVSVYLSRLQPNADVDWQHDPKERLAYLERMWGFASKLSHAFNTLKAHALYQRLVFDASQSVYDKDRFLEYLKLPRAVHYMRPEYLQRAEFRNAQAYVGQAVEGSLLPPPPNASDEPLVRDYLMQLFISEDSYEPYAAFLDARWLKDVFAETKILNGIGDPEKWYSLLDNPAKYQQLKERVDLNFERSNKDYFRAGDEVSLALDIKNVKTLTVKVYEINTANYYRELQREVDTSIDLDGLVANQETPYKYDDAPLRRVRRVFDFPTLRKSGVYVVDFIGNGKSSRAVIRKGRLHALERSSSAGHLFTVFDENNVKQNDASLWLSGHEYKAAKDGEIQVPFSHAPGQQNIVLTSGDTVSLDHFMHRAEGYRLSAGIHLEREELLKRQKARILVRPALYINGAAMPGFGALEEIALVIQSVDRDGVASTKEVPDFKLFIDQESVYEMQVPENLSNLSITLKARIQSLSETKKIDLADSASFALNQIDKAAQFGDVNLSRLDSGYVLSILGKTGEVLPDRAIDVELKHRDYTEKVQLNLQSGADGRIQLGPLDGIVEVATNGIDGTRRAWPLLAAAHSLPGSLNGKNGDTLHLPYMGKLAAPDRSELALLESRGTGYLADRFEALSLKDGMLEIAKLTPGNYRLFLKNENREIAVNIAGGPDMGDYATSETRLLEVVNPEPLQISKVDVSPDTIKVTLANVSKETRLHAVATRFEPAFSMLSDLGRLNFEEPQTVFINKADSQLLAGRDIGDEYRYIMDRKYATKYPGNMLGRPSLLLNPWAIRKTETALDVGAGGSNFGSDTGSGHGSFGERNGGGGIAIGAGNTMANLDFLAAPAALLANLKPDKDGVVSIARKDLGPGQELHLFAADSENSVYRQVVLPETKAAPIDLRLAKSFDPQKHFTERKQISAVDANKNFEVADISTSTVEPYDTLAKVFTLYTTLSHDASLEEFRFITRWPSLTPEEKRVQYSKYASHELNFFLFKKDPDFFKSTVQPFLKNKKDKTFLDHFLVEDDLSAYLKPWAYGQLNIVERILLIQRIQAEGPNGARHVSDLYDLLPPDLERFNQLYLTALKGSALETSDALGLDDATKAINGAPKPLADRDMQGGGGGGGWGGGMAMGRATPTTPSVVTAATAPAPAAPMAPASADAPSNALAEMAKEAESPPDLKAKMPAKVAKQSGVRRGNEPRLRSMNKEQADANELQLRQDARQFYRQLDKTEEWVENNYHHLPIEVQNDSRVTVNAFWKDYANYLSKGGDGGFRSTNLAESSRNFTEIMFALSVLDLPFEAQKHTTEFKGAQMTLSAKSPMIIFHKEIKEVAGGGKTPILISENFLRLDDRYRFENNERYEKYVTGEFLTHAIYGCQAILTNPTANPQKLELLMQIPAGAMPVQNGFFTKSVFMNLAPYSTSSTEYFFYFPLPGDFAHYPVQAAKNEQIVAFTPPETLHVVEKLTQADTASWDYVSQNGTAEEVITFLKNNNIDRLDLELIAWRLKDAPFFAQVVALLSQRHVYNHTLWSYAIKHGDVPAVREYLQHCDNFINQCGPFIDSKLVSIDPVVRKSYQHMEYSPLVNARAHRLGKVRKIVNDRFAEQYERLLHVLAYRPKLDNDDLLAVAYYLLLQDRAEQGMEFLNKADANAVATRLQLDYLKCYARFNLSDPQAARAIAVNYASYPVDRWRSEFAEVLAQCDEIDGKGAVIVDKDDKTQKLAALAASEPNFDFTVEARKIALNYQNLSEVRVNYYLMDIELLFSGNPFVQEYAGQFAYIRPNKSDVVKLPAGQGKFVVDLPQEYHSSNVMVEIVGAGQKKSHAYYANSLSVQVVENYGQIKVDNDDNHKPVPKAYVKVYARNQDGSVKFYKDGYTDLRGKFEYASLSTNEIENVQKFSILVLSENDGAMVRETIPPKQ